MNVVACFFELICVVVRKTQETAVLDESDCLV